jgi:molybdopterin converting factor small subunit
MLKNILGKGIVEITVPKGSTLEECLNAMVDTWGDKLASELFNESGSCLRPYLRLMVNGKDIAFLNGMETVHQEGDEVPILPPAGGESGVCTIEFPDHN